MKKAPALVLVLITVLLLLCTVGFYLWRNDRGGSLYIHTLDHTPTIGTTNDHTPTITTASDHTLVDINTASMAELMTLPGIGQTLATRIIDYRTTHGPFQSVADLLNVQGIGAGKLEAILDFITIGGTT